MNQFKKWFKAQWKNKPKKRSGEIKIDLMVAQLAADSLHTEYLKALVYEAREDAALKTKTAAQNGFKF